MNGTRAQASIWHDLTHYRSHMAPGVLRLLCKAARNMGRAMEMVWLDSDDEPCAAIVRIVDVGTDWLRIATADGTEHTLDNWVVVAADLMDAETEAAA